MNLKKISVSLLLLAVCQLTIRSAIRLPKLISDGAVLQRDAKVNVWGWADAYEKISITIDGKNYSTMADKEGHWKTILDPHKAGGPFDMILAGKNRIELKNIVFGDVWLCSGQSNMELPMRRVKPLYQQEMATANNHFIRTFAVPQKYNFKQPETDFNGGSWQEVTPQSIAGFSAVAYFFAVQLNAAYHVPVGIINASLGGSPVQAWMSEDALQAFPDYLREAYKWRSDDLIKQTETSENKAVDAWYAEANHKDAGHQNIRWSSPDLDTSGWTTTTIPGYWTDAFPTVKNGVVWFRREFDVQGEDLTKKAFLNMGRIVDADSVFINGKCVGSVSYQYPPRWYDVPPGILLEGRNVLVVRVVSNSGKGGFVPDKPYELTIGNRHIDLKGLWKMKQGCEMNSTPSTTFVRWKPMGLYNAMIAPLNNYVKKGMLWYQGEANTGKPDEYGSLLTCMISDWRVKFGQKDLVFLLAQLPNFMEVRDIPSESNWALLREAQLNTTRLHHTAMSVNIDLGEWNDIHPLHKKELGERLAFLAGKLAYSKDKKYRMTQVTGFKVTGNKMELLFNTALHTPGNSPVAAIAIAGKDKKFVWAQASLRGNRLIVWSDKVPVPVAVRYAWADNPQGANLMDVNGAMVSPFRTDHF